MFIVSSSSVVFDAGGSITWQCYRQENNQSPFFFSDRLHPKASWSAFHRQIETNWSVQSEREATLARRNSLMVKNLKQTLTLEGDHLLWLWGEQEKFAFAWKQTWTSRIFQSQMNWVLSWTKCFVVWNTHKDNCDCFLIPVMDCVCCAIVNNNIFPIFCCVIYLIY